MKRVAKLLCMVNSAPDFGQQPLVANGATDLLRRRRGPRQVCRRHGRPAQPGVRRDWDDPGDRGL